ncbi:hypothetical protein [Priestia koreensis]|uniref:hypothetical protein n=1 Tax=Priestia koreensis TaxID=284581 RepID=UPI00203C3BC7|nr:hypothetical protein [Priestia koreensis]MCM3004039.1 hypothetical protein [Priestia koreensis]
MERRNTTYVLPIVLVGVVLLIGVSIDAVSKRRNTKSSPENLHHSALQSDFYKPYMLNV